MNDFFKYECQTQQICQDKLMNLSCCYSLEDRKREASSQMQMVLKYTYTMPAKLIRAKEADNPLFCWKLKKYLIANRAKITPPA